jgi:hypothetical protein
MCPLDCHGPHTLSNNIKFNVCVTLGGLASDKRRLIRTQCFKNSDLEWRHIYLLNYECDIAQSGLSQAQR